MSANITITVTAEQRDLLVALLTGSEPAKTVTKKAQPESLVAAKQHCYEARMTRRQSTKLGGLTKAERSSLYHAHPELATMSATARKAAWTKIVVAYKAS